ncbi:4a-hydroxytetrahydrobiopterin dehydratase [Pseudonocardia spinosispora]|uniref:4a-hydroxytetrahydrobiopterin dehydratase n=1 Tax=Pseudonocardia spinosispora TaxID=103441 RepID=UPI00048DD35A|nr:4a-hydroxytetrahydrobiopterin dehydratase [Pseudonocardia spinosispora]
MANLLDDAAVSTALRNLPDWQRDGDALVLTAELPSFPAAIEVVDRVAELAERSDHHPDIDIRWRTLTFRCSTHSDGGITEKDVALASGISEFVRALRG